MKINNYNTETGWADIEHNGRFFTVRITDFENVDAVKAFVLEEDEKLLITPEPSFTPVIGEEL